jgi:ATP-dependent 26S proteasome regulatory subunit
MLNGSEVKSPSLLTESGCFLIRLMKSQRSKPAQLSPAQERAFAGITRGLEIGNFVSLWGAPGSGKTTVLRELQRRTGAAWLGTREFVAAAAKGKPDALEESFGQTMISALKESEIVIVEDVSALDFNAHACGQYPRGPYWKLTFAAVVERAMALGRKFVLGLGNGPGPGEFRCRSYDFGIQAFEPPDYEAFLRIFLGARARNLDARKIHRFAPGLSAHDLKLASQWMAGTRRKFGTEEFIEYLRSQRLTSNVHLGEVQAVDLHSLIGVDDVIRSLETHIVLPLENDELATRLALRAKRGVLLHGPPGTGKTTVGRALAHRLKGKFFLIDGTFIAGSQHFYGRVHEIFNAARQNAPAVIFIDDADAIFQNNEEQGLYRYLLTMLDGLESEGRAQVCVMMTAMNLGDLPPALVRSGRVELWLAMRLPDVTARQRILDLHLAGLPPILASVSPEPLAQATDGLTGADLKRVVSDAKAIYAYAETQRAPKESALEYFTEAIATIRANKELYEQARQANPTNGMSFPSHGMQAEMLAMARQAMELRNAQ